MITSRAYSNDNRSVALKYLSLRSWCSTGVAAALIIAASSFTANAQTTISGGSTVTIDAGTPLAGGTVTFTGVGGTLVTNITTTVTNDINQDSGAAMTFAAAAGQTMTLTGTMNWLGSFFNANTITHFGSATSTGTVVLSPFFGNVTNYSVLAVDGGTLRVGNNVGQQVVGFHGYLDASGNGAVHVGTSAASATLDLAGFNTDLFNLLGNANGIVTSSAGTIRLLNTKDSTYGGVITGAAGVTVAATNVVGGQGTLTLTNANTYSGGTTIETGARLRLGNGTSTGSVTGNITNNGTLTFAPGAGGFTMNNVVSGSGNVIASAGTTTFGVAQTYTGTTTVNSGATLQGGANTVFVAGSVTSVAGTLNLGGFNQTVNDLTLANGTITNGNLTSTSGIKSNGGTVSDISGSTALNANSGTTTLTGTNTYSGSTAIASGATLNVGNGGTTGTLGSANVTNNGTLRFNRSNALTVANNISGTGAVTQAGTGTTTLTGTNSYSGATSVNSGTLAGGAAGVFSQSSATTINTNGTLSLGTFAQTINTLTLAGGSLQSGILTSSGGITSTGGAISNITGTAALNANSGTTTLTGTNTFGSISTLAGAIIVNNGTTTDDLANAGSYTNNGTQNAVVASNTGTITNSAAAIWNGNVTTNANLITNNGTWNGNVLANTGTIANNLTWTGTVANSAGGTFNNAATGTVSGLFTNAGTLSSTGALNGGLTNTNIANVAGTLNGAVQNNAGTMTVTGALTGNGALSNAATGTLAVTGGNFTGLSSITNAGTTTVAAGRTLATTGTFTQTAGTTSVLGALSGTGGVAINGGTLSGTGTVNGPITVGTGSTLAPGSVADPLGTLTVTSALTFNAGSALNVTLAPTGQNSKVNAAGQTVTINGGTVQATYQPGVYLTQQYTLISGNVTGTFAALANTNLPAGFIASLLSSATDVKLNLVALLGQNGGLNQNQLSLANAFDAFFNGGGALPPQFVNLFGLSGTALANALDQLSPQIYGASEIAALYASQQFTTDLMSCRTPGDGAASIVREGQCLWVKGRERRLDVAATGQDLGLYDRTSSVSAGLQVSLGGNWSGGLALGYDDTMTRSGNAKAEGERFNAGAALKYTSGPLQLAAAVSGSWGNADVERFITVPGLAGTMTGKSDVDSYTAMLRAAYVIEMGGGLYAKPLADVSLTRISLGGVTEAGGPAALALQGGDETVFTVSPALEIGSNQRADWIMPGAWFRPFIRAGFSWRDEDRFDISSSLIAVPQPFTTTMRLDRMTADVAAGFDVIAAGGSALRFEYNGRYAGDINDSSISLKGSLPF